MITASEARIISKKNDLSGLYKLIDDAAHAGEYSIKYNDLSRRNCEYLELQGFKVNRKQNEDLYGRVVKSYYEVSWK